MVVGKLFINNFSLNFQKKKTKYKLTAKRRDFIDFHFCIIKYKKYTIGKTYGEPNIKLLSITQESMSAFNEKFLIKSKLMVGVRFRVKKFVNRQKI